MWIQVPFQIKGFRRILNQELKKVSPYKEADQNGYNHFCQPLSLFIHSILTAESDHKKHRWLSGRLPFQQLA